MINLNKNKSNLKRNNRYEYDKTKNSYKEAVHALDNIIQENKL